MQKRPDASDQPGHPSASFDVVRAIWSASADAMVLTDAAGTVLAANPAYCDAHECVPDDLIGKSLALIFPEAERRFAMTQYHAVFDGMATRRSSPAGVRWRDESGRVVESHIDFIAQGSHPAAMISTVRLLIAELPSSIPSDTVPDNIPERAGQHRFSRTVADLVIDAVRTWGADSIFGPPVDVTDPPGEPQRAEAARDRLDHWDDDGGASG